MGFTGFSKIVLICLVTSGALASSAWAQQPTVPGGAPVSAGVAPPPAPAVAPTVASAPPPAAPATPVVAPVAAPPVSPTPTAPEAATFPASFERDLPARPDALPVPAHKHRIWRILASGAYTAFTGGDSTPFATLTAGIALASTGSMAGRTGALHLGAGLRGYLLTPHDVSSSVSNDCGAVRDYRDQDVRRIGYGALAHFVFATRYIESSLGLGALYLKGSHAGCPGAERVRASSTAFALALALAVALDPANTVALRAEFFAYMGDEKVRSLSLGVEVHL